ncbi:MAG: tetratricopeptide repeat protein, partial [Candidatus Eisenbacteria bacterium]|nr:tetratricopeptide repeat protein [Candidatus Eisenbacteria bacterium]
ERSLLANWLTAHGQPEEAVRQAERAVAMDPKDGRVRYNAACTYAKVGDLDKAIEHLKEALANLPTHVTRWPKHDPDLEPVRKHPEWANLFGSETN